MIVGRLFGVLRRSVTFEPLVQNGAFVRHDHDRPSLQAGRH
jgi:hypothetical protein